MAKEVTADVCVEPGPLDCEAPGEVEAVTMTVTTGVCISPDGVGVAVVVKTDDISGDGIMIGPKVGDNRAVRLGDGVVSRGGRSSSPSPRPPPPDGSAVASQNGSAEPSRMTSGLSSDVGSELPSKRTEGDG